MEKKYNYFYKITNKINNHYYYGVHSTNDLNDGYMGSGKRLPIVYAKYKMGDFSKEILKFFNTRKEALEYESEIVTEELVNDEDCYNLTPGGGYLDTGGKVCVLDELTNKYIFINSDEYHKNKDKYSTPTKGFVYVKSIENGDDEYHRINVDEYNKDKEKYVTPTNGFVPVKDKKGNFYQVSVNDKRYLSGELTSIWENRHHTEETKQKMCEAHKANKHQQGEKNSQFGKCWITKDGINKSIKKENLDKYVLNGWIKGRVINEGFSKSSIFKTDEILKMYNEEQLTWEQIAKKIGMSVPTFYKYKKKYINIK